MKVHSAFLVLATLASVVTSVAVTSTCVFNSPPPPCLAQSRVALDPATNDQIGNEKGGVMDKRDLVAVQNMTADAAEVLEWISRRLMSFLSAKGFDSKGFDLVMKPICKQLTDVGEVVRSVAPYNKDIYLQYKYANHTFHTMFHASESLKFYNLGGRDHHLVRCVIQLNVMLLALRDSHGIPDPKIKDYASMLLRFFRVLRNWEKIYKTLRRVPLSVELMFEGQLAQADSTLHLMVSHIVPS